MAIETKDVEPRTYTVPTHRDVNPAARMVLPLLLGLLLGWGANELMDAGSNDRQATPSSSMQDAPR